MSNATRWIIVDDTDLNIQYAGLWFQTRGSLDNLGTFGPPFESTLHGVNLNASLTYAFSGEQKLFQREYLCWLISAMTHRYGSGDVWHV